MNTKIIPEFSFDDFNSVDTAEMDVVVNGRVTGWIWTFAGPGHPQAIDQSNRMARQRLHEDRQKEAAMVNGRKWKPVEEAPEELRERNITFVIERLVGWSTVKIDGKEFEFSAENAHKLLSDPRRASLFTQALEFLGDENSFTKRSAMS